MPKVQSIQAARPSDVLLTLSGDDASCVVTAGPEANFNAICILRRATGPAPSAVPSASCAVTAGPAPGTLMFSYRYLDISLFRYFGKSPNHLQGQNPFHPFHPARSAMFFKSLSGWLFLKHAVRFFPDCKSGFFPRGYSHSARMDFHWKEAQEACLRGCTDNPENVSKE